MTEKEAKKEKEFTIYDLPGVGSATAEKLVESGYDNLMSIAVASPGELVDASGVGEAVAKKIINTARNKLDMGFMSGEDLLKKREQIIKITTGSVNFDTMIAGGFETGSISECYGEFGSSKSQIAHVLAVRAQLPLEKGGSDGGVIFIDGESTFRPERIKQIAQGLGLDSNEVLKKIKVARAFNSDHQMLLAEKCEEIIKQENIKLIIIDSLTSHFRADFHGRGQLSDRQQKLNKHMHTLMKLADQYNLCVYVTNQVMSKPDMFFGDPTAPIGGNIVGHNCLSPNSLLQLGDGTIKPIADCYEDNEIVSVKFKEGMLIGKKNFINFYVNLNTNKIYSIDAGLKIECSPQHRFFRLNGEEANVVEVTAENLKIGDFVACAKRIDLEGKEQKLPEVKIERLFEIRKGRSTLIKDKLVESNFTRKQICENIAVTPRQLRRILNQSYPTKEDNMALLVNNLGLSMNEMAMQVTTNKYKDIIIPKYFTPEICQLLGYFMGDGYLEERSLRFRDERYDVLEHYKFLFKQEFNLGGSITKVKDKNCYSLNINSKTIHNLFEKINKNLMIYISKLPNKHIISFIKGFADAEGYVSKRECKFSMGQKDELLLRYLQMLLLRLGIRSTLDRSKSKNQRDFYNLMFSGRDLLRFGEIIGLTAKDKKQILKKWIDYSRKAKFTREIIPINRDYLWNLLKDAGISPSKIMRPRPKSYNYITLNNFSKVIESLSEVKDLKKDIKDKLENLRVLMNADIEWRRIREIKQLGNKQPLYDIEVPGEENYVANGFIVHNSQVRIYLRKGKKGTRVAKLVDSPYLPDGECIFMVTDEGIKDV